MQILNNQGDFVIFKAQEPYKYVTRILEYDIDIEGGRENVLLEYRWSVDDRTYSAWIELTDDNLRDTVLNPNEDLFLEVRVTLLKNTPVSIDNFQIDTELSPYDPYSGYIPPAMTCLETGNDTSITQLHDLCFSPYDVNPAICLHNELSYMVQNLFGHETEYFRAVPNKESQDITLQEYTLYNVEPAKCVKVMVENNQFPDSKLSYNPFGIDFEVPFEVHIDKRYFEEIFGVGSAPQKEDIIYFPINGRIYEVLSSYLFKAFMERDLYWKVSLIKYQPKAKRSEPTDVREFIDSISVNTEELFGEEQQEQADKYTKPQQYNTFIGDREYDPSRERVHKNINVIEKRLQNHSVVISEYHYNLSNIVGEVAVQYREQVNLPDNIELSYSAWFSTVKPTVFTPSDNVSNMAYSNGILTVQVSANRNYKIGDILKLSRTGGITLYGTIVNVNGNNYDLKVNSEVIKYIDDFNPLWTSLFNYKIEKTVPCNLINGYSEGEGLKIDLLANRYINVTLNDKTYVFPLKSDLTNDSWYGLFINISNKFRQLSVTLWERQWSEGDHSSPRTSTLKNIYNKTLNGIVPEDRTADIKYSLIGSNILLTNIRLYNRTAEIEKQSNILNQNIVHDSQYSLIIDNAIPVLKIPFIGQTK